MRLIKGTVNAILVATLVRPVARRMIARARRRAQEHPVAPFLVPAEGLFESALLAELTASEVRAPEASSETELDADLDEAIDDVVGRSTIRTVLLVGLAVAVVTSAAYAARVVIRRRRASRAAERHIDLVAVPVEVSSDEPVEAAVS